MGLRRTNILDMGFRRNAKSTFEGILDEDMIALASKCRS